MLFAHAICLHTALFVTRPAISYRALDLGLEPAWIGVLGATFAIIPLLLALPVGRVIDRRGEQPPMLLGAALVLLSVVGFLTLGWSVAGLVLASAVFGLGHLLSVVTEQAQVANLLRAPLDAEVTLELATPGGAVQRVTLTAGQYPSRRSFSVAGQPMPASYRFLNNVGYLAVADFDRTALLTALVDDFLTQLNARRGEGVVLDLRGNGGGSLAAMLTVAADFYSPDAPLAAEAVQVQRFDPAQGTWQTAPWARGELSGPTAAATFTGPLAVLVDDACAGACEVLAALLQSSGRGTIVGQSETAGVAGERADVLLPDGIIFTYPRARFALGDDVPIHGVGVSPDVRVPVTQESETAKTTGNDPLLAAALDYLNLVQLEPVPVTFDFVGVTSVGPRGWRYDEASRQLRRADGTGLTVIPQQGDDVAAAVAEFVGNFQGEADELETLTYGDRTWTLFAGTLFGQDVRIAGTVEAGDTLLAVLFVTNPAQVEQLTDKVLLPFLENFALDLSVGL